MSSSSWFSRAKASSCARTVAVVPMNEQESIVAARTMERCLFTLEKGLDLRPATTRDIDLASVVGRVA